MSPQAAYLDGLVEVLGQAPFDPLKDLLRARLSGDPATIHGLRSPPLAREEPDTLALLTQLYDRVDAQRGSVQLARLRRAAVELAMEAYTSDPGAAGTPTTDPAKALASRLIGRLVGSFEVRDDPAQARRLRAFLWGYLDSELDEDREHLFRLRGHALDQALQALDLWLAVTPMHPRGWPEHQATTLLHIYDCAIACLEHKDLPLEGRRYRLLLLLYRALLKTQAHEAGARYPRLVEITREARDHCDHSDGDFLELCWEYGILLSMDPDWRRQLAAGVDKGLSEAEKFDYQTTPDDDLFWRGLAKFDGIDRELRAKWPQKATDAQRSVIVPPLPSPRQAA